VHGTSGNRFDNAMNPDYNLKRFVDAQAPAIDRVLAELADGHKKSHWMWFVFPQIAGLGRSETAQYYAISSLDEAKAYLAHPTLGPRLRQCTELVLAVRDRSIAEIFGFPDDLKFRSSMTLFARAAGGDIFRTALERFCGGGEDPATIAWL
jgi:uncharacterized protein (DUF1810 family)